MNFFVSVLTMRGALAISSVFGHVFFLLPFEGPSTIGPILGPSVVDVVFSNAAPTQWSWSTARQPPSLVSSSYVFVSIVTVVSFYLTGRQLPLKKRWCTRKDRNKAAKKSTRRAEEPILSNLQTLLDPVAKPSVRSQKPWRNTPRCLANEMELLAPRTAEESFSAKRALFLGSRWLGVFHVNAAALRQKPLFFLFPGVVFPKRKFPRPKPWYWRYPWVFFRLLFPRSCGVFTSDFFFHPPLFCVNKSGATFPVPVQTPSLRDAHPPLQVVPVENEAESQGTQQHHCSWSKHKTGSVSTVAPFFCWWLSTTLLVKRRGCLAGVIGCWAHWNH